MAKNLKQIKEADLQTTNPVVAPQVEGQPLEATMIGTKENGAPSAIEQAAQRRQALADKTKQAASKAGQFVKGVWERMNAPRDGFVNPGLDPGSVHQNVAKPSAPVPATEPERQEVKDFDPEALEQQLRDETMRNYEEAIKKNPPTPTVETQTVSPGEIKPSAQEIEEALTAEVEKAAAPAAPATVANSGFAVPTPEERKAWGAKTYSENTVMSQALDDMAAQTTDPKEKALYTMMADRARQYEGWQEEENAYRRGQAAAAREMRDRTTAAAQRRDKREYEDQDPSWADTLRKVPIIQNLIGVRRLNPETMEMEWHYPRNAAEGVGALLTSLPMIAHAAVTGDNRMQKEYRGMEQNQMFYPYRMDYADMEDYRRGAMVQPTPTWSDKMAAGMGEASFGGLKEKQRLMGIETTAEYIRSKYGEEMANGYLKSALGIKGDEDVLSGKQIDQLIATAEYLNTYPNASPEQFSIIEGKLLDAIGQHRDPTDPYHAKIRSTLDMLNARRTRTEFEQSKNKTGDEFAPETAEQVNEILKDETSFNLGLLESLPIPAQQEIVKIAREYQNKLATDEQGEAEKFLRERIQNSAVLQSLGYDVNDILSYFNPGTWVTGIPEHIARKVAQWTGHSQWARDREKRGANWATPDQRGRAARRATTEDELFRLIGEDRGDTLINSLERNIAEANARKAAAIQKQIQDAQQNTVNTTVY